MDKLKKTKCKLIVLLIVSIGLIAPMISNVIEIIINITNITNGRETMTDLTIQPYPKFLQYFALCTWLCTMSLMLILWNFETCKVAPRSCYLTYCVYACLCVDDLGPLDPMYTKWSPDDTIKRKKRKNRKAKGKEK